MKQLAVISGKGGTGKTTVTAALAQLLEPLALADCDVEAPNLSIILSAGEGECFDLKVSSRARIMEERCDQCGLCLEHCRFSAVDPGPPFRVDKVACEGCGVCRMICPAGAVVLEEREGARVCRSLTPHGPLVSGKLAVGEEASGKVVTRVRMEARFIASEEGLEFLLIDGSPGIGCPVIASLTGVDAALVVTEPTLAAAHDLERVLQLTEHFGIPAMVCLNKCDLNPDMAEQIREWGRRAGAPVVAEVPFHPRVVEALREALPPMGNLPPELEEALRGLAERVREALGLERRS